MLSALAVIAAASAGGASCDIDDATRAKFLATPYGQFDQTHDEGWRVYGEARQCYREAAELIIDYILHSTAPLESGNLRILRWHAGQALAFAGDENDAVEFFRASYDPSDAPPGTLDWNSYVDATVAFLEKDRLALEAARARLAKQTPFENEYYPNLNVADGFLKCFNKSYAEAYSSDCMSDGTTP